MTRIYRSLTELIGRTPLMEIDNFAREAGAGARILAKLEYYNPAGSVKDRIARSMLEDAEKKGLIKPGGTIIEPTSGNTGIGLAAVAAAKGYKVVLTMPETMSAERRNLLKAYGVKLVLTEGSKGMSGAIERRGNWQTKRRGHLYPGSLKTLPTRKHTKKPPVLKYGKTRAARWIYLLPAWGTGGTITGTGGYLKAQNPSVKIIAVEPAGSPVLSGGKPGRTRYRGLARDSFRTC